MTHYNRCLLPHVFKYDNPEISFLTFVLQTVKALMVGMMGTMKGGQGSVSVT